MRHIAVRVCIGVTGWLLAFLGGWVARGMSGRAGEGHAGPTGGGLGVTLVTTTDRLVDIPWSPGTALLMTAGMTIPLGWERVGMVFRGRSLEDELVVARDPAGEPEGTYSARIQSARMLGVAEEIDRGWKPGYVPVTFIVKVP